MKNIVTIAFLIIAPFLGMAQGDRTAADNDILNKRASYIALRLDLTMEQAILFKEKYIEYEDRRKAIRVNYETQKKTPFSDAEAEQQIEAHFQTEENLIAAKRHFYEQLKGDISSLKLMLLPKAEAEFKKILVQRMRPNKGKKRG